MAGSWMQSGGAAANGFAPRTLLREQAEALRENGYPMPPDMRAPGRWAVSVGGIPVPRLLTQANRDFRAAAIAHYWQELTPEMRKDPRWDPENPANLARYEAAFQRLFNEEMNRWDGPRAPPRDKNVVGREAFLDLPGCTLDAVMEHICNGGSLLQTPAVPPSPPPPPPPVSRWAPRSGSSSSRSASSSSRSATSSSRSRSSPLLTPKREQMKVKPEPEVSPLLAKLIAPQTGTDDEAIAQAVAAASMDDVPPLDGPAACAWSTREHAKDNGVPYFDITGHDGAGRSGVVKEEDDGAGTSCGGTGVKKEEDYAAIRRRYRRH